MAQQQQASPAQINAYARAAIRAKSVKMTQNIFQNTFVPANTPTINVPLRNVGLVLGCWVKVVHTISNGSAVQINPTDFSNANALAQIQFQDLNNNTRIQTSGWHMAFLNSVRFRRPFGAAMVRTTGFDSPINYGSNWAGEIANTGIIAPAGVGTMTMWYWVPFAYSEDDLRGVIYANIVNATMQLQLTFPGGNGSVTNQGVSVCVPAATDSTQSMYVGNIGGAVGLVSITGSAVTVYQVYLDQLPTTNTGVLLPVTDLATLYEMKLSSLTGMTSNTDFGYQYVNFRDIVSTMPVYVQAAATGARGVGADINSWSLQAANSTNIWKKEPALISLETRNFLGADMPPGAYYFGTREKPISTTQYGNMQLVLNALTVGAGAYMLVGIEDFSLVQALSMAGSLPTT